MRSLWPDFAKLLLVALLISCSEDSEKPTKEVDPPGAPPRTLQEHWVDHTQLVTRVFYDDDVAVYFDKDVAPTSTWMFKYIGDVWRYTKDTYGAFGEEPRLYAVFHQGRYGGGHPAMFYEESHDFRNMIDCGMGSWDMLENGGIDLPTHEVFHIVEFASFDCKGSPGFDKAPNGIWGDSKFAEIYQYDVYKGLGLTAEVKRYYNNVIERTDDYPRPGTYWFRDWFFPIYRDYGETQVLVRFFRLLSESFPKDSNNRYKRQMNWGEFVHFFSGATGKNLKAQAEIAFGWTNEMEKQFVAAQQTFTEITYEE
jgi:hypothetical protein